MGVQFIVSEHFEYEAGCAGKDKFPSENSALAFAEAMHRGGFEENERTRHTIWRELSAYKCHFCPNWHLGHDRAPGQ